MRKCDELALQRSCINRALPSEMLFVLLGRDKAAPAAIRHWVSERVRLGLNKEGDAQIVGALNAAAIMEVEQALW